VCKDICSSAFKNAKSPYDDCATLNINKLVFAQSRATNLMDKLCRSEL
jgi:hypothetical protein